LYYISFGLAAGAFVLFMTSAVGICSLAKIAARKNDNNTTPASTEERRPIIRGSVGSLYVAEGEIEEDPEPVLLAAEAM